MGQFIHYMSCFGKGEKENISSFSKNYYSINNEVSVQSIFYNCDE